MSLQGEGKELEKRSQSGCPSLNQLVQVQAEQFAARGTIRSLVAQSFPSLEQCGIGPLHTNEGSVFGHYEP